VASAAQTNTTDQGEARVYLYDVLLVDCDSFKHVAVIRALMAKSPMPNLKLFQANHAVRHMPFRVKQCVPIEVAVAVEMALEMVGATADIIPSKDC